MADSLLSEEEVDALLKGVAPSAAEAVVSSLGAKQTDVYHLATAEHITRHHIAKLESINEPFLLILKAKLEQFLSRPIEVDIAPITLPKYADFINGLKDSPCFQLIHLHPLSGMGVIIIDANLIAIFVDSLFGGDGRFHTNQPDRKLTLTEERIVSHLLNILFEAYTQAWQPIFAIHCEHIKTELNPSAIKMATPEETIVCTPITLTLGPFSGTIYVAIPYVMIEPIGYLLTDKLEEPPPIDPHWRQALAQQLQFAEVDIAAHLGTASMCLKEVLNLRAGDVIPLTIPPLLYASVDNTPVMACQYGIYNHHYALKVEKILTSTIEALVPASEDTSQGVRYG